jgi:hypothetical protein
MHAHSPPFPVEMVVYTAQCIMHVCIYVHVRMTHVHMHIHTCTHIHMHAHAHLHAINAHACMHACVQIHVCVYMQTCECVHHLPLHYYHAGTIGDGACYGPMCHQEQIMIY